MNPNARWHVVALCVVGLLAGLYCAVSPWLPRRIGNETRWLEWATFEQWYVVEDRGWDGVVSWWKDERWVDT